MKIVSFATAKNCRIFISIHLYGQLVSTTGTIHVAKLLLLFWQMYLLTSASSQKATQVLLFNWIVVIHCGVFGLCYYIIASFFNPVRLTKLSWRIKEKQTVGMYLPWLVRSCCQLQLHWLQMRWKHYEKKKKTKNYLNESQTRWILDNIEIE